MRGNRTILSVALACVFAMSVGDFALAQGDVDSQLKYALAAAGFTGKVESTLESRLGRKLNPALADLGRLLWFDKITGLRGDNACGGCHSPSNAFGDSKSMAIGIQNNNVVGPLRAGPRNQRRTPSVVNSAFFPALMWNGRFFAPSGDPFNNSLGFTFPVPEGTTTFPPKQAQIAHLLIAQAHLPPTELVEAAGFAGTAGTIATELDQFDDGIGLVVVPPADSSGFRNQPIRQAVLARLNASTAYRKLFDQLFKPVVPVANPIDFVMVARAIAEFEFTLTFANAPIDRFARGETSAMSTPLKQGAIIFFGKGRCSQCHSVGGESNEMFSDFKNHNIGVPQVAPFFGVGQGNVVFDGANQDEDFGLEQISGNPADRYKFRTSPLRNVALQSAFFHNGAYTRLDDAIRHHLAVSASARQYSATAAGLDRDLTYRLGPIEPVLASLDPVLATPILLTAQELADLIAFVRDGLLDPRAAGQALCKMVPAQVPSGLSTMRFDACSAAATPKTNGGGQQ